MKKKNIYIAGLLMCLATLITTSCNKFVNTPLPINSITATSVFNNDAGITGAVDGAYNAINNIASTQTTFGVLFSDEVTYLNANNSFLSAEDNTYDPTSINDYGFFTNYYTAIYQANAIIGALTQPGAVNDATAIQAKGEAYFIRAYCHFQLVNFYGNVPLITTTDVNTTALEGNTPEATTYTAMISDLKTAYGLLTASYPTASRVRVNSYAAAALLAKVYLYDKDYVDAEAQASIVINSGTYSLPTDLTTVFLIGSNETIWQLYNLNTYTPVGQTFIPLPTTSVIYQVTPGLLNAFEPNDKRMAAWVKAGTGAAATTYYPYKYKQRSTTSGASIEYLVELRLADEYLIRSEARAQQNNLTGSLTDLNVIRTRAGLPNAVSTSQSDLLLKIEQERRIEMSFENANRWFDLNRTGRTSYWLSPIKPTFTTKAELLPYPESQLIANPNLKQNPGY